MADGSYLRVAVPGRGRLRDGSTRLLKGAGIEVPAPSERSLVADSADGTMQFQFVRARDVVELVANGSATVGITGRDVVAEHGNGSVEELMALDFGRCSLCIAAPEDSGIATEADLRNGLRVATKYPVLARQYFARLGKRVEIVQISGNAEAAPRIGIADVIADIVETGETLRANRLCIVSEVMQSCAVVVGRAGKASSAQVVDFLSTLQSVLDARGRRFLTVSVPSSAMNSVRERLNSRGRTIVGEFSGSDGYYSIHAVVDESDVNRFVIEFKNSGCRGIAVSPLERFIA